MPPDVNAAVVSWIREGGTLIYVGDGSDPFHKIDAWWGQRGYANPAEHLFELAGLGRDPKEGVHEVGAWQDRCLEGASCKNLLK